MSYTVLKSNVGKILFFTFLLLTASQSFAQKNSIKGVVIDTAEKKKLQYAIVALINLKDSALYRSIRSTEDGSFSLNAIPAGKYQLMISYPRMADFLEEITVENETKKDFGKIPMVQEAVLLADVVVRFVPPIRMKGDTLEYTADSFMVKQGANVQELLKRLPGITVDKSGKITAQGKEVEKVLVDGDEFFSDDPGLAAKYLRANAVDKVQVFDQKSDATEFTGIDDGKRTKTINLKLKSNKKNGYFGKLATANDLSSYYNHEAMGALFSGPEKISVFGMAYKIGGNASPQREISKYISQDYERIEDGIYGVMYSSSGYNDEPDNYASGIPSILYGGAHYSNKWHNNNEKLFTNYRIRHIDSYNYSDNKSTNILPGGTSFTNTSNSYNTSNSQSQKAGGTFTIPIDSFSNIKVSLNGSWSYKNSKDTTNSDSKNEKDIFVNNSRQSAGRFGDGRNISSNISYEKKYRKKGKSLSISLQNEDSYSNSDVYNYAANAYFDPSSGAFVRADSLNQLQRQLGKFKSVGAQAKYSDRFTDHFSALISYGWKWADATNVFSTYNKNNGKYDNKVDTLSNDYDFIYTTHIAEGALSWNWPKLRFTVGSKMFVSNFKQQNNDIKTENQRNFVNYAPTANLSYSFKQAKIVSLNYNGQTSQPSVEQLQPLRKSSNPLYVQIGNANLIPSLRQSLSLNYNSFNWQYGKNFYAYLSGSYTKDAITSRSSVDSNNRTISQYINLNSLPSFNSNANYGWEYKKLHLRPSVGVQLGSSGSYSFINGVKSKNSNIYASTNIGLRYKLKELLEVEYTGSANYNAGKTTINNTLNETWSHSHNVSTTVYLPHKFEFATDAQMNFQPKNSSFNTSFNTVLWNASLTKKVLKNDNGVIKFSINNILNTNTGYRRSVYGGNTSESNQLVIRQYWLLGFAWDFSKSTN